MFGGLLGLGILAVASLLRFKLCTKRFNLLLSRRGKTKTYWLRTALAAQSKTWQVLEPEMDLDFFSRGVRLTRLGNTLSLTEMASKIIQVPLLLTNDGRNSLQKYSLIDLPTNNQAHVTSMGESTKMLILPSSQNEVNELNLFHALTSQAVLGTPGCRGNLSEHCLAVNFTAVQVALGLNESGGEAVCGFETCGAVPILVTCHRGAWSPR